MALNFQDQGTHLTRLIAGILAAIGIAMIAVYAIEGDEGPLHRVQQTVHSWIAPIQFAGSHVDAAVTQAEQAVADASADEATLSSLKEKNAELTRLLTQAEEYRLESERLRGLLDLKDTYHIEGIGARIIGRSSDAWNQTVTIDVGTDDGVQKGLTVMGSAGVIGQVMEANAASSVVRLLTDPNSGVAAQVQSSRVEGIVTGSLSGALHLENVSASAVVNQGDVVLTSGLGGSFTKGLLIGTVVRVEGNANDGTRVIVVAPNEEASSLEEVTVVFSASESGGVIKSPSSDDASSAESSDASSSEDGS